MRVVLALCATFMQEIILSSCVKHLSIGCFGFFPHPQNHFYNLPQLTNSNSTMNATLAAASPAETKAAAKDKPDKHKVDKHKGDKHKADKPEYRHLPNISSF